MCDVIKIRLKIRIATRSGKGNQLLNIKTAVEGLILKLGIPSFRWKFYLNLFLVASLLFRHIFMTSHMTLSRASTNLFLFKLFIIADYQIVGIRFVGAQNF